MNLGIDVRWLHEAYLNAHAALVEQAELDIPGASPGKTGGLGGIGRYLCELLPRLARELQEAKTTLFFLDGSELPEELASLWPGASLSSLPGRWRPKGAAWGPLWKIFHQYHQTTAQHALKDLDLDIFFSPHQLMVPDESWARVRLVTCHDLAYMQHPDLFFGGDRIPGSYESLYERLAGCERILAVSRKTAAALQDLLGIQEQKIVVIHEGVTELFREEGEVFSPEWPYVLHIGGSGPGKNLRAVVDGWRLARDNMQELHLVLAGARRDEVASLLQSRGVLDDEAIHCSAMLDDGQLRALYQGAELLLMPSIVEGFGLPVLEAMACGCPVITSRSSPMEEFAGEAAIFIDHRSPEQLAYAVGRIRNDPGKRRDMREMGQAVASKYTWEKTAHRTARVIVELCE